MDGQLVDNIVLNTFTTNTIVVPTGGSATTRVKFDGQNSGTLQVQQGFANRRILCFMPGFPGRSIFMNVATQTDATDRLVSLQGGSPISIWNDIQASCESYRVTAATIKIHYIGRNDAAAGEIIVKKFDPNEINFDNLKENDRLGSVPMTTSEHCKSTTILPGKDGVEIALFQSHLDGFKTYKETQTAFGTGYPSGAAEALRSLEGCVIWLQGFPNGTSLRYELVTTMEVQPKPNTILGRIATPSAPDNPVVRSIIQQTAKHCGDNGHDVMSYGANPRARCAMHAANAAHQVSSQLGTDIPSSQGT